MEVANITLEVFNENISNKVLSDFERCSKGIIDDIDVIRTNMCKNTQNFIKGFNEETDNVFMLVEYHQLMNELIATVRYFCSHHKGDNIIKLLKEIRENHINELLRFNVKFNSTSIMRNLRNLNKVEAYQKLIRVIDGEIKDCERCHNARYKKMLNKK